MIHGVNQNYDNEYDMTGQRLDGPRDAGVCFGLHHSLPGQVQVHCIKPRLIRTLKILFADTDFLIVYLSRTYRKH